jgi:hypothetical protein
MGSSMIVKADCVLTSSICIVGWWDGQLWSIVGGLAMLLMLAHPMIIVQQGVASNCIAWQCSQFHATIDTSHSLMLIWINALNMHSFHSIKPNLIRHWLARLGLLENRSSMVASPIWQLDNNWMRTYIASPWVWFTNAYTHTCIHTTCRQAAITRRCSTICWSAELLSFSCKTTNR